MILQKFLNLHQRNIYNHESEGDHVEYSENNHKYVLVCDCRNHESKESSQITVYASPDHRIVAMPDQPVMNGVVPLPPVLSKASCIPPVGVESSVREPGDLGPQVCPGMKNSKENHQPEVRPRDSNTECVNEDAEIVSLLKMNNALLTNGHDMLIEEINDQKSCKHNL